jgi:MSHA biogenesis protein MshO
MMRMSQCTTRPHPPRGFTLVELVMVIAIAGIIAAVIAVFFKPAFDAWLALRLRGDMTEQAVTALNTMQRDVRIAVPNSVRLPNQYCFELVPTSGGGRFRMAPDTTVAAGASMPLDLTTSTTTFDSFTALSSPVGSMLVIDNQNPADVYASGVNRMQVTGYSTAAAPATIAAGRVTLSGAFNDSGYTGGRFVVVPSSGPVFYTCSGAGADASGNGTGTLRRYTGYGFNSAYPSACPAAGAGDLLADHVSACTFIYNPNAGATQQSGFVSMELELERSGEIVHLLMGAHVSNVP